MDIHIEKVVLTEKEKKLYFFDESYTEIWFFNTIKNKENIIRIYEHVFESPFFPAESDSFSLYYLEKRKLCGMCEYSTNILNLTAGWPMYRLVDEKTNIMERLKKLPELLKYVTTKYPEEEQEYMFNISLAEMLKRK